MRMASGRFQFSDVPCSCWSGGVSSVVVLPVICPWDDVADSGATVLLLGSSRSSLTFCISAGCTWPDASQPGDALRLHSGCGAARRGAGTAGAPASLIAQKV